MTQPYGVAAYGFTIVRHSAYLYHSDPAFARGLELAFIPYEKQLAVIKKAGAVWWVNWSAAENAAQLWMYPAPQYGGLIPQARGRFVVKVAGWDGAPLYIPTADDMADLRVRIALQLPFP